MDPHYFAQLERIANQHLKKYLDPVSHGYLIQIARSLGGKIKSGNWIFEIPRENPLIFREREFKSDLQINVTCKIECIGDNIEKNNIEVLVKSISKNRKIFQFHIDQKDSEAEEPWNHLHIDEFNEPRFPFPPMDLILICEFMFINYFPERTKVLRKDGGWRKMVRKSQDMFQQKYFSECQNCIEHNKTNTLQEHLLKTTM